MARRKLRRMWRRHSIEVTLVALLSGCASMPWSPKPDSTTAAPEPAEEALKGAVERNGGSAVAWNELGATQRLRGEFPDAATSYEKTIAADSNYAPAYRNLGVVSDLYLGDPERALTALERYKELT